MRQFYTVTTKIKEILEADSDVNTVTLGDLTEVDLAKQNIFPLSHIVVGNVTHNGSTFDMDFTVLCMDIVDTSKKDLRETNEPFFGQNDLQDIWNTQLAVSNNLIEELRRGDAFEENFHLSGGVSINPFKDRFENLLAGWSIDLTITVPNTEICV